MNLSPLRKAAAEDIPHLMEIRPAVLENRLRDPSRVTASDYAWFITHSEIWVWTDDGAIQRFAAGDPRDGSIWALFGDPCCEGRGIGRALLVQACSTLRAADFETVSLATMPGTRAEAFYRANGWITTGQHRDGHIVFNRRL
jgi:GNAT superfamily N-acetyltransferase